MNTHSLTLHNMDAELYKLLVVEAESRGWSLNKTGKAVMGDGLGLVKKKKKKHRDLSWMKGVMTSEEWDQFDKIIEEEFEQIDEEDWK